MSAPQPPLSGMRVFDLSQGVAGPYCTMMLAAHGADVIKVEPFAGDWIRGGRVQYSGHSPASITVNIGKRSIAMDLKHAEGRALAQRIAASCDIVVESFRPGVVGKLGLDHDTLSGTRPDLIYASISGFGSSGPLAGRGVIDQIMQAFSGWMVLNEDQDGTPQRTRNVVLADQITGLYAYQAISSALIARLRFGRGARLDLSLLGAMAAFLSPRITGHVLSDGKSGTASFAPPTGEYPTRDGLLMLAVFKPGEFERLCTLLGRDDLPADASFATVAARAENAAALEAQITATLARRTALEWEALLSDGGVMASAVRTIGDFIETPQARAMELVESLDLPDFGTCPLVRLPGAESWSSRADGLQMPVVGQHSGEILRDIGLNEREIAHHLDSGCVRAA